MNKFNQPVGDPIPRLLKDEVAVLVGTGPSINEQQIKYVRKSQEAGKCKIITMNNSYEIFPTTNVHLSCNRDWWEYSWPRSPILREMGCPKYTWYKDVADKYGIQYVKAVVKDGLSLDPRILHINHGSSPMCLNLALHLGVKRLLLIGHDMKFDKKYDGRRKKVGDTPRHFFGEYPKHLQHWPSVKIGKSKPGVIDGLIEAYNKMPPDLEKGGMEVVNCTPGSALPTFPMSTLEEEL